MLVLIVILISLVSGCASVPMATPEEDASAKQFIPNKDKSSIYLYRNESFGGAIPVTVSLDGKVAGQTGPMTYFMWQVDPGKHDIQSMAENNVNLSLEAEAGQIYFVWQEIKMGVFMARTILHKVDDEEGRKGVLECKRAQSNF
ncbi:hypothetical protein AAU61_19230 [Desulfocarbo indianensis]|nr:hypothetical protein AAU61_19230 [Desulfocarbo indianensis]